MIQPQRDRDFMTLLIHGDLIVLPVRLFDRLMDEAIAHEITDAEFMGLRSFVLEPESFGARPANLPAPSETPRGASGIEP